MLLDDNNFLIEAQQRDASPWEEDDLVYAFGLITVQAYLHQTK